MKTPDLPHETPARFGWRGRMVVLMLITTLAFVAGLIPRLRAKHMLAQQTQELALPTVSVTTPHPGTAPAPTSLSAEVHAFVEAPIYARANGFLKRWLVDIGDQVSAGQLLAEIDTPEVDQQLRQVRAELAQAQAALDLAKTTANRWNELLKTASVSEQEVAEKRADFALKTALLDGATANLRRLEELKGFANVAAPFAGTITRRLTDVGQLIVAGNGRELFHLAQTGTLRVYVRVPQSLSPAIKPGQAAELIVTEHPGRKFEAKVVRTAGAVEPDSRTMLVELEVDNQRGEILAGSYAQVRFADANPHAALTLPSTAILFRAEGLQVGVVGAHDQVELRSVKLGRDFGPSVEVLEGVQASDRVIVHPSDSLSAGATVRVIQTAEAKPTP
jgi:RND family efflux transporter MFP subunit